jgi:hypothetical protein
MIPEWAYTSSIAYRESKEEAGGYSERFQSVPAAGNVVDLAVAVVIEPRSAQWQLLSRIS